MSGDNRDTATDQIRSEAADWFARLRGEPTTADQAAFAVWRAAPANADAYDRLVQRWEQTAFLANSDVARARDLDSIAARWGSFGRTRWLASGAIAAAAAIILLVTLAPWRSATPASTTTIAFANSTSAVREVRLADGSLVELDQDAAIEVRFTRAERHVVLRHGRARFVVSHDMARPFSVEAEGGSIVAHGTVFDVALERGLVRVTLIEGSIEVRRRMPSAVQPPPRLLKPGQETTYAEGRAPSAPVAVRPADWTKAMIAFDQTRLADAAAAFDDAAGPRIEVVGPAVSLRISGAFRRDDPAGFADAAAAMFNLRLTRRGDVLVLGAQK